MATQEKTWNVANRLHSLKDSDNPEVNHIIAGADEIYDDTKGAKQSDINAQTDDRLNEVETDLNAPTVGINDRVHTLEEQVAFEGDIEVENAPHGIISGSGKVTSANAVRGAIDVRTGYFVCESSASIAAKTINASGFVLTPGGSIKVLMQNANTANDATLNISSTGAKPLYYAEERASANNSWEAGEVVEVFYDGTNFYANNVAGGSGSGDGAFDISAKTGQNYETLSAALTAANSILSASKKKGGMSIKFIKLTPAKYTVVKTEGATEQPTGTELQSDPGIISGTYEASQLSAFSTLPATLNSSLTYYLAVTETVDEQEVTTYTSWVITYAQSSDNKYVQYRLMHTLDNASTAAAVFANTANWQGVDDYPTVGSNNLVESGGIWDVIFKNIGTTLTDVQLEEFTGVLTKDGKRFPSISTFNTSDYIPVYLEDTIALEGYSDNNELYSTICGYSDNKEFVEEVLGAFDSKTKEKCVTINNENIKFIRISLANSSHPNYLTRWVNIIRKIRKYDILYQNVTEKVNIRGYVKSDGSISKDTIFSHSNLIFVTKGTKIRIYLYGGNDTVSIVYAYDANKQPIGSLLNGDSTKKDLIFTIENENVRYIVLSYANSTHDKYVEGSKFILINNIDTRVDGIDTYLDETPENLIPSDSRLDANTVIYSSFTKGWAAFRSASIEIIDDYIQITPSSFLYSGIRNDKIPIGIDGKIVVSFEIKAVDTSGNVIFFYYNDSGLEHLELTNEWVTYEYIFNINDINRFQFASYRNTIIPFQIRNFSVDCITLPVRVANLENAKTDIDTKIDGIDTRVENLENTTPHLLTGKKIAVIGDSISTINGGNTPGWTVKSIDVGNIIKAWVTIHDVGDTIGGVTITDDMVGYLQSFTPLSDDIGKQIGKALNYNSASTRVWSQQLCDMVGCTLVANASWSGSQLIKGQGENEDGTPKEAKNYTLSYAWSDYTISRLINNRDDNGNTIVPDIIFIYRGTNDATHSPHANIQDVNINSGIPTTDLQNGERYYQLAAAILVNKLRTIFPNTVIYFCTLNYFRRGTDIGWNRQFSKGTLAEYNECIRKIATKLGCGIVDFEKDGITANSDPMLYYVDGSGSTPTHPNTKGHEVMAKRALADVNYTL